LEALSRRSCRTCPGTALGTEIANILLRAASQSDRPQIRCALCMPPSKLKAMTIRIRMKSSCMAVHQFTRLLDIISAHSGVGAAQRDATRDLSPPESQAYPRALLASGFNEVRVRPTRDPMKPSLLLVDLMPMGHGLASLA
jgi:hypothetical protein